MLNIFKKKDSISNHVIKTELSILERTYIVDEVVTKCFIDDEYHAEFVKPTFVVSVLKIFTDIKPVAQKNEDGTESEKMDIEATYKYIVDNHIMDCIVNKCKYGYIDDLYSEAIESIEYRKAQKIASTTSLSDDVIKGATDVINEIKKMVSENKKLFGFIDDVKTAQDNGLNIIDSVAKVVGEKVESTQKNAQQKDVK